MTRGLPSLPSPLESHSASGSGIRVRRTLQSPKCKPSGGWGQQAEACRLNVQERRHRLCNAQERLYGQERRHGLPGQLSSPSFQHGHHPSCNRPRTLTAATGQCMSGPAASVIGAAEVPAGPVERQIRLNEIELKSIKSNPIALNLIKRILFNSLQTFSASTTFHSRRI